MSNKTGANWEVCRALRREQAKREDWQGKSVSRGQSIRNLNKKVIRLETSLENAYKMIAELTAKNELLMSQQPSTALVPNSSNLTLSNRELTIYRLLKLYNEGKLSFRGTSRVTQFIENEFGIEMQRCPQSIISYVIRLSMVRLRPSGRCRKGSGFRF
jgi:hypothetical protein